MVKVTKAMVDAYEKVTGVLDKYGRPALYYGMIPLIIVVGMTTQPRPTLAQLLSPV